MIADVGVLAIVIVFIYSGYKAGLMRSFVKIASYFISLIISFFLYPVLSKAMINTNFYNKLVELIGKRYISGGSLEIPSENMFGIISNYINGGLGAAANGIASAIATLIINLLAFVIILILSKVLIRVIGKILGVFTKLPVIKQFNRLGGSVMGGFLGIIFLYIISAVLVLFAPLNIQTQVAKEVDKSVFAAEIFENNFILSVIGREK